MTPYLDAFAQMAQCSCEYQGHGWGCAVRHADGSWAIHRNVNPIWESERPEFGETDLLLAHARSAFRNEGITVANNMPFADDRLVFIFNGELRAVRLNVDGRIGAEKVFNFIKRFTERDGVRGAIERGTSVITQRSAYVRAMNLIIADGRTLHVHTQFGEEPDYFTLRVHAPDRDASPTSGVGEGPLIIASEPLPGHDGPWTSIPNGETRTF